MKARGELTLQKIQELGIVAVVLGESRAAAVDVSRALVEGGVVVIEVAFTTPEAHRAIEDLGKEYGERILLGAGTVTTKEQAAKAIESGAEFLVSPGCDAELLLTMLQTGLATIPGVLTPSEIMLAGSLDVSTVKLFPGSQGGSTYLEALRGPFPETNFVPTGGVSLANIPDWFAAGACAVGVGGSLTPPALRENRERDALVARAKELVETVRVACAQTSRQQT